MPPSGLKDDQQNKQNTQGLRYVSSTGLGGWVRNMRDWGRAKGDDTGPEETPLR